MANVIWKQRLLQPVDTGVVEIAIDMPVDAQVLGVAEQYGELQMWVLLNSADPRITRRFSVIGTGIPVSDLQKRFVGTVVIGYFVWHVFEIVGQQINGVSNERN